MSSEKPAKTEDEKLKNIVIKYNAPVLTPFLTVVKNDKKDEYKYEAKKDKIKKPKPKKTILSEYDKELIEDCKKDHRFYYSKCKGWKLNAILILWNIHEKKSLIPTPIIKIIFNYCVDVDKISDKFISLFSNRWTDLKNCEGCLQINDTNVQPRLCIDKESTTYDEEDDEIDIYCYECHRGYDKLFMFIRTHQVIYEEGEKKPSNKKKYKKPPKEVDSKSTSDAGDGNKTSNPVYYTVATKQCIIICSGCLEHQGLSEHINCDKNFNVNDNNLDLELIYNKNNETLVEPSCKTCFKIFYRNLTPINKLKDITIIDPNIPCPVFCHGFVRPAFVIDDYPALIPNIFVSDLLIYDVNFRNYAIAHMDNKGKPCKKCNRNYNCYICGNKSQYMYTDDKITLCSNLNCRASCGYMKIDRSLYKFMDPKDKNKCCNYSKNFH